jgi:hypothetical protein
LRERRTRPESLTSSAFQSCAGAAIGLAPRACRGTRQRLPAPVPYGADAGNRKDAGHQGVLLINAAGALDSAVAAGREMLRLAPSRGGTRGQFARYEQAATQIRTALTSVEALSRGAVRPLTVGDNVPAPVPDSLRDLAETVRTLDEYLDDPAGRPVVREPALRAAAQATLVLEQTSNLSVSVIVAQVRSTAAAGGWPARRPSGSCARQPTGWRPASTPSPLTPRPPAHRGRAGQPRDIALRAAT